MTRTVIILRARYCGTQPRPGDLMAAETGTAVYRLEAVSQRWRVLFAHDMARC